MRKIRQWAIYLWASPTTMAGLLFFMAAMASGGSARIVHGVIECRGGLVTFFLKRCTLLKGGASAMTLGHVVLGIDPAAQNRTRRHERVHVRQCERWGPLFLPAYLIGSIIGFFRSGQPYLDNPFEVEAYQEDSLNHRSRGAKFSSR